MKFRNHYFKREATISDADTIIIDINVKDPISALTIEYEATNGATSSLNHELHDDISSIELVDGSNVLWSLDMQQARALNFFETKQPSPEKCTEKASTVQEESCVMHFGRFMDDSEYYINPSKYNNLQLRLTHSLTISATAGFATGTGKVTVRARIIEEGARPYKGFLSAKEKVSYTSVTSGDKEIDLPRDFPYRLIMLQALITGNRSSAALTKHKLSIDADNCVPFNDYSEDIVDANIAQFGLYSQQKELLITSADATLMDVFNIKKADAAPLVTLYLDNIITIAGESITHDAYVIVSGASITTASADFACRADIRGAEPYACIAVPFGRMDEPRDWLQAANFGDIKLFSTQAVAAACSVVLQQLHP